MAYKQIHEHIWKDEWFMDLEPFEKLLFIYLFANESVGLTGLYKINLKVVVFETGLEKPIILDALAKFEQAGKVFYRDGYIWVVNLTKYNVNPSPTIKIAMQRELNMIPDNEIKVLYQSRLMGYPYSTDGVSLNITEQNITKQNIAEQKDAAAIFSSFENNIQLLTKGSADIIDGWIKDYPEQYILDAIQEAVKYNKRNPAYIGAILKKWGTNGRSAKKEVEVPSEEY